MKPFEHPGRRAPPRGPDVGGPEALERFLSALESVGVVPFSGEFLADGTWHAPYSGPGIHLLLGGDFPEGMDGGAFWETRVVEADRPRYSEGMAQQRRGESCQMEYRIQPLTGPARWIRECSRARPRADGSVWIDGIVIDVSEHRAHGEVVDALEAALVVTRSRLDSVLGAIEEYLYAWRYPASAPACIDFESIPQAVFLRQAPDGGTPEEEWVRSIHPDDRDDALAVLVKQATGEAGACEYRICDSEGGMRWLRDTWTCRHEPNGDVIAEGIVSDVTLRRQAQEGLAAALAGAEVAYAELDRERLAAERAAETDPLTGIFNRRSFARALEAAVADAATAPFGLVVLDVDRFKRTNDTFGHRAGDDVLVEVVRRLQESAPGDAILGRWGGEEFTVLLPGVESDDDLRAVAEALRLGVRGGPIATWNGDLATTISCGCVLSSGALGVDALLHEADAAMLRAKQSGRDRTLLSRDASTGAPDDRPELLLLAQTLAETAGIRGAVTEPHSAQVAELAAQVASALDLPAATVLRCRLAGWLHDVGKVAIPDRVLEKAGPLNAAEVGVMRRHAAFGADLVARTPGISESARAVRHHHERWDGDGYPDGLAGLDIPIEARIVAAADTWNAMTQDRVYRRALGFDAACAELLATAGSQLDPRVAAALLAVVRQEHLAHERPSPDELAA